MALMKSKPLKWTPRGCSDTLDASNTFTGAMQALQDLIRDPTTLGVFQCRPASTEETDFTGGPPAAGFVSWFHVVGDQVYGLVESSTTPGFDEPFCYNMATNAFVAVSGITGANVPSSPASSGDWVPPTSDVVATKLIVTHPGFPGGVGNYFGWFDISNPGAPTWSAGNTTTNALPVKPVAVKQFNNRAYFASGQYLVYSDVLAPTVVTNATQALTLGDNQNITAIGALPANNLTGAVLAALIVFKSESSPMQLYQITGDAATSNLQRNDMQVATGTLSPATICATPKGLAFMAPDGLRFVGFDMIVTDPINTDGTGVAIPFLKSADPTRMVASCNGNIMRVSTQNGGVAGAPQQEWWLDFKYTQWTGPHTFPASWIKPYLDRFVIAPVGVEGKLFESTVQQDAGSTFIENGVQMAFNFQTPMLPDAGSMSEHTMVETTIDMAFASGGLPYLVSAGDQNNTLFDSVQLIVVGGTTLWGAFEWGVGIWGGAANALTPRQIPWTIPITFRRLNLAVQGDAALGVKIGTWRMRYQELGYLQQLQPVLAS